MLATGMPTPQISVRPARTSKISGYTGHRRGALRRAAEHQPHTGGSGACTFAHSTRKSGRQIRANRCCERCQRKGRGTEVPRRHVCGSLPRCDLTRHAAARYTACHAATCVGPCPGRRAPRAACRPYRVLNVPAPGRCHARAASRPAWQGLAGLPPPWQCSVRLGRPIPPPPRRSVPGCPVPCQTARPVRRSGA